MKNMKNIKKSKNKCENELRRVLEVEVRQARRKL